MEEKQILWENSPLAFAQANNGQIPTYAFYGYVPFLRNHNPEVYDSGYKNGMAFAILWQVFQKHKPENASELWNSLNEEMRHLPTDDSVLRPIYKQMMHEIQIGL